MIFHGDINKVIKYIAGLHFVRAKTEIIFVRAPELKTGYSEVGPQLLSRRSTPSNEQTGSEKNNNDGADGHHNVNNRIAVFDRRLLLFAVCFFFLFCSSIVGWNYFDKNRRILGAALLIIGVLVGLVGYLLLVLSPYRWTWGWWL